MEQHGCNLEKPFTETSMYYSENEDRVILRSLIIVSMGMENQTQLGNPGINLRLTEWHSDTVGSEEFFVT